MLGGLIYLFQNGRKLVELLMVVAGDVAMVVKQLVWDLVVVLVRLG